MPTLNKSMKRALRIVAEVRGLVPNSFNYGSTSSHIQLNGGPLYKGDGVSFQKVHNRVVSIIQNTTHNNLRQTRVNRNMVSQVSSAVLTGDCGNCLELSFLTAQKLRDDGANNVDIVRVKPVGSLLGVDTSVIPHWFAVVGRSGGSSRNKTDIGLPSTWGNRAVVVDSWDRVVYPASSYTTFWSGLEDAADGRTLTCELFCRI